MLAPAEYTEQCVTAAETEASDPETKGQASMYPPVPHRTRAVVEASPALSSASGSQQGYLLCQSRLLRPLSSARRPSRARPCGRDMGAGPSCRIVSPPHARTGTVESALERVIHRPRQHQRPHPLLHHLGLDRRQLWRPLAVVATARQARARALAARARIKAVCIRRRCRHPSPRRTALPSFHTRPLRDAPQPGVRVPDAARPHPRGGGTCHAVLAKHVLALVISQSPLGGTLAAP